MREAGPGLLPLELKLVVVASCGRNELAVAAPCTVGHVHRGSRIKIKF